jgi:hypothetical protein
VLISWEGVADVGWGLATEIKSIPCWSGHTCYYFSMQWPGHLQRGIILIHSFMGIKWETSSEALSTGPSI